VRRIAVPRPGGDAALRRLVADVMSWRLDRDRPLWEIWIIEGLNDNRWAILTKVHHCMADGIAATHMLAGLCDGVSDATAAPHVGETAAEKSAAPSPSALSLNPVKLAGGFWNTSSAIATGALKMAHGVAELALGLARPGPSSTLNGPVGNLRRYGAARVSMRDVAAVCQRFDVTVNDVALAAITESYRDMLIRHGERPHAQSLRTLVPVSTRATDARHVTDNRVSLMLPYLPVDEDNPLQRLDKVNARLGRAKSHGQRQAGSAFVSAANLIPFPVTAWGMRLLTRLPQRGVVTLATNVPGPRQPLHIIGHKVLAVFPVPPIAMNLRTGVAILSYADDLFFGILADYDTVPDVDALARGIEVAVARLAAHRNGARIRRHHGRLTLVHTA
jgi:WS/DGAT/MGAT family acyltransferase